MNISSDDLDILAKTSHEIRNPVNAILGVAYLLRDEQEKEVQEELIKTLIQTAENLRELTSYILDFSKLKAGKVPRRLVPVDIRKEVPVVLFANSTMARAKGLEFIINIAEDVPSQVLLDKVRGMQVLTNLVSNAVKFTREGSITVGIKVLEHNGRRVNLSFSVKDTGMGIPEKKQKTIFEPFRQGGSQINLRHGGTGLGLSIANMFVIAAGGELKLKSQPGKGAEFYFEMPMRIPGKRSEHFPKKKQPKWELLLKNRKVLIVDDNEVNLLVTGKVFKKRGIDFQVARSGAEALEKVQEEDFEAVLMDLHMPGMNGYDATCAIRNLKGAKYKHLPIIALSGSTGDLQEQEKETTGFTEFLSKPFKPQVLLNKIGKLIAARHETMP